MTHAIQKSTIRILATGAALFAVSSMASASALPPGGAVALTGSAPSGVLIWDQLRPYTIDDAGGTTIYGGDIHEQVLRQGDGTLTFRWTSGGGMVGLGFLSGGTGTPGSVAFSVSADGSVVVGLNDSASGDEAFRWTSGGGMVGLGDLAGGSFSSIAWGVSADGLVVVGRGISASGDEAFRWTSGGGMVGLGDFPGGSFRSVAFGVSADGSVVVGQGHPPEVSVEAFR